MYEFFLLTFALFSAYHLSNFLWLQKKIFLLISAFNLSVCASLLPYSDLSYFQALKGYSLPLYFTVIYSGFMGTKIFGLLTLNSFLELKRSLPGDFFLLKCLVFLYLAEFFLSTIFIWNGMPLPRGETLLLRFCFMLFLAFVLVRGILNSDLRKELNQLLLICFPYAFCALILQVISNNNLQVIQSNDLQAIQNSNVNEIYNVPILSLFGAVVSVFLFTTIVHRKIYLNYDIIQHELSQSNELLNKHIEDYKEAVDERTRELRIALQETEEKEQEIAHINQVVQTVNSTLNLDKVMESVKGSLQEIFAFDQIEIGMVDEQAEELVIYKAYGDGFSDSQIENLSRARISINDKASLFVSAVIENTHRYIASVTSDLVDTFTRQDRIIYDNSLSKSYLLFPLEVQNRTFGIIVFGDSKKHFDLAESDIRKIQRYVLQIATAINNAHLADEIKKTQAQLVQAEKMAGLGTLVAGVAHEINNPTNFVYGASYHLENNLKELKDLIFKLAGDDADKEFTDMFEKRFQKMNRNLSNIKEGSERIKIIVNDLRNFSRLDESEKKRVSIIDGIESTLHLIQSQYKKQVEFVCDFKEDPSIVCWPAQLNQVFMNVMSNACQAIIKKQNDLEDDRPGKLRISTYTVDGKLNIEFADSGCGMSEDVRKKMFDPFFTTKGVGEGTGMGMSISYGIIEKHEGRINVESQLGIGTTLKIILPINLEESPPLAG